MLATGPLLCAAALALALSPAYGDRLIHNVNGYGWMDGQLERFESLLIDSRGRVAATGPAAGWPQRADLERVDGAGATLLPGLIDSHGHVLALGLARRRVDLAGARSLAEALERVAAYAARFPGQPWILGRGWNQELWGGEFPRAADLDAVEAERPVWLSRVDDHAGWANSRAMALAGIDIGSPAPAAGMIRRDEAGLPTGIFIDEAEQLIERVIPEPSLREKREALTAALQELAGLGLTSVHDAGVTPDVAALYRDLADRRQMPIRIYAMLSGDPGVLEELGEPVADYGRGHLSIRSVKLYADGALGSRGAALLMPYADEPGHRGLKFHQDRQLESMIHRINAKGFQACVHAIGDAANAQVLDAFAAAQGGKPGSLRNRVEHAQVLALADIERFSELGVIASMQPIHATSDMWMAERRLEPERLAGAYAWRRLLAAGTVIAAGSDFPVEPANPFFGLHAAVTRQDRDGRPDGGWYPGEVMSREEALRAFTLEAAYAAHQEGELGSLEPGAWADFILVDRDFFAVEATDLWQLRVLETWVGGERVYRDPRQTSPSL